MVLKDIREIVLSYYTDKGLRRTPIGIVQQKEVDSETESFLRDLVKFLLTTDYLFEEAKIYLTHNYWTFKHVYSYPAFKGRDISTMRYRLAKAKNKLNTDFGSRMLIELLDYHSGVEFYRETLEHLTEEYSVQQKFRRNYSIPLPKLTEADMAEPVDMARVEALLRQIAPYKKCVEGAVTKNLDKTALSYIYRLLENQDTSGKYKEDRSKLKRLLAEL